MNNIEIKKINNAIRGGMWAFIINVIMLVLSIVMTLITKEITLFDYMAIATNNIMCSILLAFIFGHTSVSDTSKNEEKTQK